MAPLLRRERSTIAQFDLDRRRRATNVAGAFGLAPGGAEVARQVGIRDGTGPLAGWWVVLVDDVVTTGATLAACAEPLLAAGAIGVSAVTVARER
jgi:predicted amidophosphoribosyltransferase